MKDIVNPPIRLKRRPHGPNGKFRITSKAVSGRKPGKGRLKKMGVPYRVRVSFDL